MNLIELVFTVLSIAVIVTAIVSFFKTPQDERFKFIRPIKKNNQNDSSFAPEYSFKEKKQIILKQLIWAVPLFIFLQFYFFPWLDSYAINAHCYNYVFFTGMDLIFYGLFVFLPFSFFIVLIVTNGKRNIKIIRLGQDPLPGEKVFKPTKYIYGFKAKIKPMIFLLVIILVLTFSIKGFFWADEIINNSQNKELAACTNS